MASRQHNEYLVRTLSTAGTARTHAYWFHSRGSSISPEFISPEDRDKLWQYIASDDTKGIDNLLPHLPLFRRVFNAILTPYDPVFLWSNVDLHVQHMLPEGLELTHDPALNQGSSFYIERRGFWAFSADDLHKIRLIFGWQPSDEPGPQSIQIRYIGPQRFRTFDSEIGRLLQEKMQQLPS
jgi:hypothetical protein